MQSGALSKEGINQELDKLQVERVTSVSSPALSSSASNGNNSSEAAASSSPASSGSKEKSSRAGDIVGGVLGVLVVVVLSGLAFYRWRKIKISQTGITPPGTEFSSLAQTPSPCTGEGRYYVDTSRNLGSGSFADVVGGTYRFQGQRVDTQVAFKIFRGGRNLASPVREKIKQEVELGMKSITRTL